MAQLLNLGDVDQEYKNLRLSAFRSAIEIAPYVNEITIGPLANATQAHDSNVDNTKIKKEKSLVNREEFKQTTNQFNEDNNGVFTFEKLLYQCELQQREAADSMIKSMLNKMVAKRAEMMSKFWHQQDLEYERRSQERRKKELEILNEWTMGDKLAKLEQQKLDEQNRAHSERMCKLLEKQLESTKLFDSLNLNHGNVCNLYQHITNISSIENDSIFSSVYQKYEPTLSSLLSSMNSVMEICKSGTITVEDVKKSSMLELKMKELKDIILQEYDSNVKISQEISVEKSQAVIQENQCERVDNCGVEDKKENENKAPTKVKYCSDNSINSFIELKEYLESYQLSYQELLKDSNFKKFRFDCQKAINTPINSISSVNGLHLKDKFNKLMKLLNGDRVQVGDAFVSCTLHPQGKAYCTNLLARKIVNQGAQLVSSNPEAAFPLASVVVALWSKFSDLGKLILAHFQQQCPYLIPMMIPQCEGQSDKEYYQARGYIYDEDGCVEKHDKFLKRMSGIFRLCAAIWITKMPYTVNGPHPQGLAHAWRWMAAFVNLDPEVDITATLLYDFLSVCGSDFYKCYQGQFVKFLQFLLNDYCKRIEKIDEGGPKTRLEVFLQNVIKDGYISKPKGFLSEKFW